MRRWQCICLTEWAWPTVLTIAQLSYRLANNKRVAIARSLANRPKLLLADEPTANVDPASSQMVIDLIRETCTESGIAMVMVTHSMDVAKQFPRVEKLENINRILATAIQSHA